MRSQLLRPHSLALLSAFQLLSACADDSSPRRDASPSPDMTQPTADQGSDLTSDSSPTCKPKTCADLGQTCGSHDDGCGQTLDCGACECPGGQAPEPSCGPCGLGQSACGPQGATCSLPELPGLDASTCATGVVYVDAEHAGPELGSREAPFTTLRAALDAAGPDTKLIAVRADGLYRESITLKDGVHLVGGFDDNGVIRPSAAPS